MTDYILSVTKHDEVNLMSSLLAQEIGVKDSYTLVHRPGYAHVYDHLGVSGTASSHELISNVVTKYLPNQVVLTKSNIANTGFIAGEFQVPSQISSKALKLKDLAFPIGAFVVGRSRGAKFVFADHNLDIYANDTLICIFRSSDLKAIESALRKIK